MGLVQTGRMCKLPCPSCSHSWILARSLHRGHSQTEELCFTEISPVPASGAGGFSVRVPGSHHCPLFNFNLWGHLTYLTQAEKRVWDLMKCSDCWDRLTNGLSPYSQQAHKHTTGKKCLKYLHKAQAIVASLLASSLQMVICQHGSMPAHMTVCQHSADEPAKYRSRPTKWWARDSTPVASAPHCAQVPETHVLQYREIHLLALPDRLTSDRCAALLLPRVYSVTLSAGSEVMVVDFPSLQSSAQNLPKKVNGVAENCRTVSSCYLSYHRQAALHNLKLFKPAS